MKRFLLLLALMIGLATCLALSASAETGKATFYNGDAVVSSVNRNSDGSLMLIDAPDTGDKKFIGWVLKNTDGTESLHAARSVYNGADGDLRFEALTVDLRTAAGAAVTFAAPNRLRFDGALPLTDYQRLLALAGAENVTTGMVIAPYAACNGAAPTRETAGAVDRIATELLYSTETWAVFAGTTDDVADSALLEKFCARAYLTIRMGGNTVTVYADYSGTKHARSVYGVNAAAFADRSGSATGDYQHQTDAGCYSPFDATKLAQLRARLDKVVYVSILNDTTVQSKYSLDNFTFYDFACKNENGDVLHSIYTSPYRVDRVLNNSPAGYDTYVITGADGADFNTVTAYFIGGSYRAPDPSEWQADGIYLSVEQPSN